MGSRVAQYTQGIQRGNRLFGFSRIVNALRLIDDDDRIGILNIPHSRFAVQLVLRLIDDVFCLFESINIDDHDFNVGAGGKLPYIGKLCGIIDKIAAGNIVVLQAEMLLCNLKRFIYALSNSNGRHNDDEFRKSVPAVQLKNRFRVYICLTGTGFHLDTKLTA